MITTKQFSFLSFLNICTAACHLWTFLQDTWMDPVSFCMEFISLKSQLCATTSAIVYILEIASGMEVLGPHEEQSEDAVLESTGIALKVIKKPIILNFEECFADKKYSSDFVIAQQFESIVKVYDFCYNCHSNLLFLTSVSLSFSSHSLSHSLPHSLHNSLPIYLSHTCTTPFFLSFIYC